MKFVYKLLSKMDETVILKLDDKQMFCQYTNLDEKYCMPPD